MAKLRDEDREREEYIRRVKAEIERHKKMCAELERACKNIVSEIWQQGAKIDELALEAEKPLTNGALKKENAALKEENERLKQVLSDCEKKRVDEKDGRVVDMTRPQPCSMFDVADPEGWAKELGKHMYDVIEDVIYMDRFFDCIERADEEALAEKLTNIITVCTSWIDALGYDESKRGELQERVNEKNRRRGDAGDE